MSYIADYNPIFKKFLSLGLKIDFLLHAHFPNITSQNHNHQSAFKQYNLVTSHIQKEVEAGYIAGLFVYPPFDKYFVSPLRWVHKKESNKFWLVHDLSFPKKSGINATIS
jgi:hypothetical protein